MFDSKIWTGTELPAILAAGLFAFCLFSPIRPWIFAFVCFVFGWNLGLCFMARSADALEKHKFK